MYQTFVDERFIKREKKIFDPIKKNVVSLFRTCTTKTTSKDKTKISHLKNDCSLFQDFTYLVRLVAEMLMSF